MSATAMTGATDTADHPVDFQTHPDQYRHWRLSFDGEIARLDMDVSEDGGLFPGYDLKLNSYDLGVDIELHDAVQRLRFEHPEVRTVVLSSGKDRMFCAGANIRMLGSASHALKVNFCKFTNETRNSIEDASEYSRQTYLCAINGMAAGGGYELALATDHIMMADDGNAAVALPEVPLLAVLPGTGGLTRVLDKRKVRRDLADVFCTIEEGVKGQRAVDWGLVDAVVPASRMDDAVREQAQAMAGQSDRPGDSAQGVELTPLQRRFSGDVIEYEHIVVRLDRDAATADITLKAVAQEAPSTMDEVLKQGAGFWVLALARELDDLLLHLRVNELEIGSLLLRTEGDPGQVAAYDALLGAHGDHWLMREIRLYWRRVMKRLDLTSRSLFALVTPGSCFTGFLAEILFAVDRSYMLDGIFEDEEPDQTPATIRLTDSNFGPYAMSNGLTRLQTRFYGHDDRVVAAERLIDRDIDAEAALTAGLVTFAPDDIDWDDEVRLALEERRAFSPDALVGMEANLRFAGPETMETRIFGRLTAWQNWIFQRPNAAGDQGALKLYGSGRRADYDRTRV
ncbi:2,3-epoxybenzoyl-CoA dihydrolase [Salinisphaera sp. P385]|uniref:2,3-epoxybenzoyl-CoA dihydrolase n=1 Tax=Spectribacter acetivorans TaxID=3075603 RepID=A0ABU3B6F8_9GAMM|nr:2,3-epoxybenzoyl-CoA dihydrolase [Salinisphaera sp. P385]MDT0617432.1 2,3-epoxybenzoyl-CoA dihydrolase [Salinisphaera sp. P385]